MIPFVMVKTAPLAGSAMDSDNYWHDSLRGIRWDATVTAGCCLRPKASRRSTRISSMNLRLCRGMTALR